MFFHAVTEASPSLNLQNPVLSKHDPVGAFS
jgi:hypothetical protein